MNNISRLGMSMTMVALLGCGSGNSELSDPDAIVETSLVPSGASIVAYDAIEGMGKAEVRSGDQLSMEGDTKNGLKHGSWVTYSNTGAVESVTTYYLGKKQGVNLNFDRQGYLQNKMYYHNDELHGEFKAFKRSRLIELRNYRFGKLDGMLTKYYDNGKLLEESPYINGELDGIAKWYDQEGNLSIAYRYESGELVDKDPDVE